MKTLIVMTIIGLVVCVGQAEKTTGGENEEMLAKAGQDALAYYEQELKKVDDEIYISIEEFGSDRVITGEEMVDLRKKVAPLVELKKEAAEHLETYNLIIRPELKEKIETKEKIIFEYFGHIIREGDRDGNVRKLFAQLTGQDFKIGNRFNKKDLGFSIGLIIFFFILFVVSALRDWHVVFLTIFLASTIATILITFVSLCGVY